jgi:hypothetical protein
VAQLYPRALGSLYVVSHDSQGYGGGILTLPYLEGQVPVYIAFRNRMVQFKVQSQCQSQKSKMKPLYSLLSSHVRDKTMVGTKVPLLCTRVGIM